MIKFKFTKLVAFLAVFVLLISALCACHQGTQTPESSAPVSSLSSSAVNSEEGIGEGSNISSSIVSGQQSSTNSEDKILNEDYRIDRYAPENKDKFIEFNGCLPNVKDELIFGKYHIANEDGIIRIADSGKKQMILQNKHSDEIKVDKYEMYNLLEAIDDHRFIYTCGNAWTFLSCGIYDMETNENFVFEYENKGYKYAYRKGDFIYCYLPENRGGTAPDGLDMLEINLNDYSMKHYPIPCPENYCKRQFAPDFSYVVVATGQEVTADMKTAKGGLKVYTLPDGKMTDMGTFEFELDFAEGIRFYTYPLIDKGGNVYIGYSNDPMVYNVTLYNKLNK